MQYGHLETLDHLLSVIFSNKEVFDQFNTNVFGTVNIARAVTPYLREAAKARQNDGGNVALANFGSVGSWISGPAVAFCGYFLLSSLWGVGSYLLE